MQQIYCAFNQNKMIDNAQYVSVHLLGLNVMLFSIEIQNTSHDVPQQITVYCCCWHLYVVITPTLKLKTHLPDILISTMRCQ